MTTDRELLLAAAKAAGLKVLPVAGGPLRDCTGMRTECNALAAPFWNPLTDDGDALRLAVALGIGVQCHTHNGSGYALAQCGQGENEAQAIDIQPGADPYKATRRAIVRAAVSMAKEQA